MSIETKNKVSTRLFVGCLITSEIRMHLTQSIQWKHAMLATNNETIQEIHYQNKEYLGLYLAFTQTTLEELKKNQDQIRTQLKIFCPNLETENVSICIFPQVFVA